MAEPRSFSYKLKDLAEILVKEQGLDEGFWGISIEFALGAAMMPLLPGDNTSLSPVAIVPITKIGIHRFDEPNSLTVNAAEVNPSPAQSESKKPGGDKARVSPTGRAAKKPQ